MEEWLSAPGASPEARRAIEALDAGVRNDLDLALESIQLHAGDTLFAPGDPRDAVFLILSGRISLAEQSPQGDALPERVLGPGEGVGEIAVVARGPHTATARALEDARLYRLDRIAFEDLCEKYPEPMSGLAAFITPVAHEALLAQVICDLVGERDAAQLAALLAGAECRTLKRGDILTREGQDCDCMYIVIYGRLRIVVRDEERTERVIDEVGRGDTVGERRLLTGDLPSATVYALRDSAVGVITRSLFVSLQYLYPELVARLTRIALRRAQHAAALTVSASAVPPPPETVNVAVLPAGAPRGGLPLTAFAARLAEALSAGGPVLHLNSVRVESLLGRLGIAQASPPDPWEPFLANWLARQQQSYSCLIFEADPGWTPWTERCLRMTDRVLLVGQGAFRPAHTELDEPLARLSELSRTELVLLQPDSIARPSGTAAWLDQYAVAGHDHVRLGRPADFERFVRRITGRGLGLVLGGGAARGFAHVGVFRALAEWGIDVDVVGGTSMGAILGAAFAMGLDDRDSMQLARELASPVKLFDPTMPVVSFFASGKVTKVLERIYGDTRIEDLWTPFFCVSSNLTHAVAMVHRRGPLWQAVRASMAIPGVFSPVLSGGDLLVDGCVLNNLPIDVMRRVNYGGPIIAVNVFPDVDLVRRYDFGPSVSGWQALASKLNPLHRTDSSAPLIFESLVRVLALNGVQQAKAQRGLADVYIRPPVEEYNLLDFGAYQEIADIGYRSAMEVLGEWASLRSPERAAMGAASGGTMTPPVPEGSVTAALSQALAGLEELLGRDAI